MFLEDISISFIEPCFADTEKIRLKADFSADITEMMPYINAVLKNATFNKDGPLLTFMKDFRLLTLYPEHMTLAKACAKSVIL